MWTNFDISKPPKRWCLIRFKSLRVIDPRQTRQEGHSIGDERDYAVLSRWSERGHCFINQDLMGIPNSYKDVASYIETPYSTINEVFKALGGDPQTNDGETGR